MYGQSDIAGYKPAAGDLAYPEKLEMMRTIERERREKEASAELATEQADTDNGIFYRLVSLFYFVYY